MAASGALGLERATPPSAATSAPAALTTRAPTAEESVTAALLPLPEPTMAVVESPQANVAVPSKPDVQLAVRAYVVEAGDSVRTIAGQFGVTNETIIWENDLTDPDILQVGQELHVLPFSGLIHEVRPGDTVASVANSYDALIPDVIGANKLTEPFIIVVGQKLAVPGGYRPLPRKIVISPPGAPDKIGVSPAGAPDTVQISPAGAPDTVQAPPANTDQVAAVVNTPPKRTFPSLGNTPQEQFIASIGEAAVESADNTGVPASVTIAQAILESYWGSSRLAREANNYFGIKAQTRAGSAGSISFDVWEVIGGRNVMQTQAFRAYKSVAESFVDHGRFFLENGRYAAAMAVKNDPRQFAREVNRAGYATDPAYASKLIALMDRYNLYRYDQV